MSKVHIRHIRAALERLFASSIDLSDWDGKPDEERKRALLSRALAAYALTVVSDVDAATAAKCVIDGFDDNGIDAIYFDETEKVVYLVQSKWIESGIGSPPRGDIQKFIKGFWDLIEASFDRFNQKLAASVPTLQTALDDPQVTFQLLIPYTGQDPLSSHVVSDLDDLLREANDPGSVVSYRALDQKQIHAFVSTAAEGDTISVDVQLLEWGHIRQPYQAFYGHLNGKDIAQWWVLYGNRLFARNLRKFKDQTEVNEGIATTLRVSPTDFWYFNNGITILCNRIGKTPKGGSDRTSGVFACEGISIVNGAQTVGSIGATYNVAPDQVDKATVLVRLISLEDTPESWATSVTRAANTQNRIGGRDFAALDPEQERLRRELWLDGKHYAYKSGDPVPQPDTGCTIDEATVALACANPDISLAVQAKREVGKLWEDISKPPYTLLFSPITSASALWRTVEVARLVESELRTRRMPLRSRDHTILVHGNRFVLAQVFRRLAQASFQAREAAGTDLPSLVNEALDVVIPGLLASVQSHYPSAMLPQLFKNLGKCKVLDADLQP